jgi:predicted CXXCH cytochrome family protein
MRTSVLLLLFIVYCIISAAPCPALVEAPRNPDSAKECAICHYRWIDTFYLDGRGTDLVPYQQEKVVAKIEMCFTCHDGSVVDSRAKVYNDKHHNTDKPPPEHMNIPKIFPLDEKGNMQCATCHTAHGVPSDMGSEKTIFIRTSNNNSSMCKMCHADKNDGAKKGNHPIGTSEKEIPETLMSHGGRKGDGKNEIICETCHTVHGSPNESFLIESARNSGLCLECHADKNIFDSEGKRNHQHVVNVKPVNVKIPAEVIEKGAKLGWNGEIICQTCHKIHNNHIEKKLLLIMKDKKSSLCLTCHKNKEYLADTKHNLEHSAPEEKNLEDRTVSEGGICSPCHLPHKEARAAGTGEDAITRLCLSCHNKGMIGEKAIPVDYRHPLGVNPFNNGNGHKINLATSGIDESKFSLPLFNKNGMQDHDGNVTCTTCHDPHKWRPDSTQGEIREDVKGDNFTSFLRKSAPDICRECHTNKFFIENSEHDIARVAPEEKNSLDQTPAESGICGVCHLVHGGQKGYLWARKAVSSTGNVVQDLCIGCHNEQGMAKEKTVKDYSHPVNISLTESGLTTTLPLFDKQGHLSDNGLMTCETCHDPHRWSPDKITTEEHFKIEGNARNSFLRMTNSPSPELCGNCHKDEFYVTMTDHDMSISETMGLTAAESGTCGVCHNVHNSRNKPRLWAQGFGNGASIMDRMCNYCHDKDGSAKDKIPAIDSHPDNQLINNIGRDIIHTPNYFPLFNDHSGEYMSVGNISCPSCHNVHQWDPKFKKIGPGKNIEGNATNSFLRMQTYSLLCIDCHGLDALFRFKYYHDVEERVEKVRNIIVPDTVQQSFK